MGSLQDVGVGGGGGHESFWEGTGLSKAAHTAWNVPSGIRRAWADHHRASEAAAAAGACCSGLRKRGQEGSAAAKMRSANPRSHYTIRWSLRPRSGTFSAPTHGVSTPTRTQSSSRSEGRPTCQTTFVGSPGRYGARNPASGPFGQRALESHPPPRELLQFSFRQGGGLPLGPPPSLPWTPSPSPLHSNSPENRGFGNVFSFRAIFCSRALGALIAGFFGQSTISFLPSVADAMPQRPISVFFGTRSNRVPVITGLAILHDAHLQPPEVGLQHDGPAVAHHPRRELLGQAEVEDR